MQHACCALQEATPPDGDLAAAIERDFGSLNAMQTTLSGMCAADKLQACPCLSSGSSPMQHCCHCCCCCCCCCCCVYHQHTQVAVQESI